jgi:hypothetical protein
MQNSIITINEITDENNANTVLSLKLNVSGCFGIEANKEFTLSINILENIYVFKLLIN